MPSRTRLVDQELHSTLQQRGYPTTRINKGLKLAEKIPLRELRNKDKIKEILDTTKIIKSQRQPKNRKRILTSSTFEKNTTQGVTKCKNKRCKICDIIIEGKSYTLKNPETKFKINKNLSCNSKNVVYVIKCNECKEIYIGSTQALNTRTSLHWSNIKIEENRKSVQLEILTKTFCR